MPLNIPSARLPRPRKPSFWTRTEKKKPKFISEEIQARLEQNQGEIAMTEQEAADQAG
jgi:hypothetical protein